MSQTFPPPPGFEQPDTPTALSDVEQLSILTQHLRKDQLNDNKLLKFIAVYLDCRNAAQAARESGGQANWLRKPEVYTAITAINAKAVMKYGYDAHEMIERAKEIATIDPVEFERPDGSYKRLSEMPPAVRRAIKKIEVRNLYGQDANGMAIVTGQVMKIELWDKLKAVEMLGPEKGIFKKTTVVELDVTKNMASILLESSRRAEGRTVALAQRDVTPQIEGRVDEENRDGEAGGSDEG